MLGWNVRLHGPRGAPECGSDGAGGCVVDRCIPLPDARRETPPHLILGPWCDAAHRDRPARGHGHEAASPPGRDCGHLPPVLGSAPLGHQPYLLGFPPAAAHSGPAVAAHCRRGSSAPLALLCQPGRICRAPGNLGARARRSEAGEEPGERFRRRGYRCRSPRLRADRTAREGRPRMCGRGQSGGATEEPAPPSSQQRRRREPSARRQQGQGRPVSIHGQELYRQRAHTAEAAVLGCKPQHRLYPTCTGGAGEGECQLASETLRLAGASKVLAPLRRPRACCTGVRRDAEGYPPRPLWSRRFRHQQHCRSGVWARTLGAPVAPCATAPLTLAAVFANAYAGFAAVPAAAFASLLALPGLSPCLRPSQRRKYRGGSGTQAIAGQRKPGGLRRVAANASHASAAIWDQPSSGQVPSQEAAQLQ
mmetsp:Transcript_41623/g.88729  ORF Transcript_41623/g.88729 Transcript_41623/m.88729 type:complete len:421 (-) Transcript_41623:130-1392(-)